MSTHRRHVRLVLLLAARARRGSARSRARAGQARRALHRDARRHPDRQGRLGRSISPTTSTPRRRAAPPPAWCASSPAARAPAPRAARCKPASRCRSTFAASITSDKKTEEVRVTLANGNVKDVQARSAAGHRAGARAGHRRAPPRRHRSDDRLADARARHRRPAVAGGLPAHHRRSSTAACATICSSPSSAWTRSRPRRAMTARWWSARSISCRSPATCPSRAAIKYLAKQRDMEVWLAPIAGTRVLVPFRVAGSDADRPGRAAGHAVRLGPDPAAGRGQRAEDAVSRHARGCATVCTSGDGFRLDSAAIRTVRVNVWTAANGRLNRPWTTRSGS